MLAGKVYVGENRVDKAGALLAGRRGDVRRAGSPVRLARRREARGRARHVRRRPARQALHRSRRLDRRLHRLPSPARRRSVAAVDVGYGQLAHKLRSTRASLVLERTNAKTLEPEHVGGLAELVVVDASFIGLGKLMPARRALLAKGGEIVALVKPQFEVGREEASRGKGVVRDPEVRARAITGATDDVKAAGLVVVATATARSKGRKATGKPSSTRANRESSRSNVRGAMERSPAAARVAPSRGARGDLPRRLPRHPRVQPRPAVPRAGGPRHVPHDRAHRHDARCDLLAHAVPLRARVGARLGSRRAPPGARVERARDRRRHDVPRARAPLREQRRVALRRARGERHRDREPRNGHARTSRTSRSPRSARAAWA